MDSWAVNELQYADLGDKRRNCRLIKIVEDLAAQPSASVPQASGDWAATKRAYEFWKNPRIKASDIRLAHQRSTIERVKQQQLVLAVQDTTELNFTHHPDKKGVGYLDSSKARGLKVHSTLCVSSEGVPLGLLNQQVWARDLKELGKKRSRHKRLTKDKESQRWITALLSVEAVIPEATTVVTVADREADIYDLLATPRRDNSHLLIRASHNRYVRSVGGNKEELSRLQEAIGKCPVMGEHAIELRPQPNQGARERSLKIRSTSLEIQPPTNHPNYKLLLPLQVQVILAEEDNPPDGVEPIRWLIITTLPVTCFADAVQYLQWYSYRWLIERYHYVLKSGCRLEELQLETDDRIERALSTYTIVAGALVVADL